MSSYYSLLLNLDVLPDIDEDSHRWVSYMMNGEGERPKDMPLHPYFSNVPRPVPLPVSHRYFGAGRFHSSYWVEQGSRGIHLWLPSIKNDDHYWHAILFVDWLCSLAKTKGCVGVFQSELNPLDVIALFAADGGLRMYLGSGGHEFSLSKAVRSS